MDVCAQPTACGERVIRTWAETIVQNPPSCGLFIGVALIIHLEAVTREQLQSPEGQKEARAAFRRNMDRLSGSIVLDGPAPDNENWVPLKRGFLDHTPNILLPRSKASESPGAPESSGVHSERLG
jgi:hypothetical protein